MKYSQKRCKNKIIKIFNKIIILFIFSLLISCTNHLEKKYSEDTYNEDLIFFKENGINKSEIKSIKYYVSNIQDSTKLIGVTYEQIIISSEIIQDSLIEGFKNEYLSGKDSLNIVSKINLIENILDFDVNNEFAINEIESLNIEREKKIVELKEKLKTQKNSTKKVRLYEEILSLDKNDTIINKNLTELYIQKKWFKNAKKHLSSIYEREIISKNEYQILSDKYLIRKNPYSLLKITKGGMSEKRISKGYSISNVISGSGPSQWNVSSKANGYVTNVSKTLTVDVIVYVKFNIKIVTTVSAWFLTKTKTRTKTINKSITLRNIKPGKSKSFSASAVTNQESYSYGNSKSKITDVDVSLSLLSTKN